MADLVMGAMGSLIPKLYQLLEEEYCLQTSVKQRVSCLANELEVAQAALCKVALFPWDELDEQVQLWARQVREASYDMEDVLDTFLVRVQGPRTSAEQEKSLLKPLKKMNNLLSKSKARHKINVDVNDIMSRLQQATDRCRRYMVVDDIVARPAKASTLDPRLHVMYTQVKKLVGINEPSHELMSKLQLGDMNNTKVKIVSVVGVGGLGKTTLAKAVYDKLKGDFDCAAFVPVGRKPDLKKIFKDLLIDLDRQRYLHFSTTALDERQLIDELRNFFLENKRYLIIIDDLWEIESWETIKLAMDGDINSSGRIVITTRNMEVARIADEIYKLSPLCYDSSRELFFTRIVGSEAKYVDNQTDEISDKFLSKCGGIPLAIITMASLLAGKQREEWPKLYNTFDFGSKENREAENTMRILSFSYYDLPSHLRTCLLYLSAFPEDSVIDKGSLVWMWVGEGFIQENAGVSLFEIGVGYFNDLINRSMIQSVESNSDDSNILGCRVHDMVLDFIRSKSREENIFMVLNNDHDTQLQNNVRRMANHNRIIVHTHKANHFEMPKLRSFIALSCVIETWASLSSFTLLRVLAIENCKPRDGSPAQIEHIRHLLHLRFLSLSRTRIERIPEEIGALRFLQTLDLWESHISKLSSWNRLPKTLARLRITLEGDAFDCKMFSVEGMTSLEELAVNAWKREATRRLVKELGSLRELRVLNASILYDEQTRRDLVESLRHLHKLQTLTIYPNAFGASEPWQATELVLPCHLRHLSVYGIKFYKLPSCINPLCLPNLSHLDLRLEHMDEKDLKTLAGLPELRYLGLSLFSSAKISNISDSDACYFPKLRCCRLPWSMALFVPNKQEDKSFSFHIWNGIDDIMPFVPDELERPRLWDDELQSPIPMPSVSDDELHRRLLQKLQRGIAAVSYNLHAVFQLGLVFVKRWFLQKLDQYPLISNHGCTPTLNREDPIGMPFVSDDDDGIKNDSICSKGAAAPPFMQSLQVLQFEGRKMAVQEHPNCCGNLGLEYLSSLREINVDLSSLDADSMGKVTAALRRTAQVHPNRPTLCTQ